MPTSQKTAAHTTGPAATTEPESDHLLEASGTYEAERHRGRVGKRARERPRAKGQLPAQNGEGGWRRRGLEDVSRAWLFLLALI